MTEPQDATMASEDGDPGSPTTPAPAEGTAASTKDGTKWKHYPLRDKIRVVDFLRKMRERDHGHPEAATIAYFEKQDPPIHLTRKTIHKWEDARDKLAKALEDEENGEPQRKRPRKSKNPAVEAQLVNFCTWAEEQGIPVTGPLLKQKLKIYQERLGGVELVGSNGWLQAFYGYYGIKLAGCKEVKAALRAQEDADFSDDPDGKKRRLRKRRAAAKKRRANAKLAKMGGAPLADNGQDDEDEDDDEEESDDEHEQVAPAAAAARAPPQAIARPAPQPTARKTGAKPPAKTVRAKPVKAAAAQPRTTTTMQIEHLTQQQSDPMMHWDNGNYQAGYGDMDESGDDDYYPAQDFAAAASAPAATTTAAAAATAADPSGWTILDNEKISNVRHAATTLLGLALERSDVGLDNVQQNMISVLEWCRRQEETLVTNAASQAVARAPAQTFQQPAQASTTQPTTTHHSARLPAVYAANTHTPQPASARPTYSGSHQQAYTNQYAPSTYSTLASASAAAAPSSYQLPHSTASYAGTQQGYHTAQTHTGQTQGQGTYQYGTGYGGQGYGGGHHPYSSRIGI